MGTGRGVPVQGRGMTEVQRAIKTKRELAIEAGSQPSPTKGFFGGSV